MNKSEFISELILLFDDFTKDNTKARVKAYNTLLTNNIDYDDLYKNLLKNTTSFRYAPTPAVLLDLVQKDRPYNPYL